jgi:ribosomal protein S18 acetylase RimI-like enzyme
MGKLDYNLLNKANILAYMRSLIKLPCNSGWQSDWGIALNTPVNSPALNFIVNQPIDNPASIPQMIQDTIQFFSKTKSAFSWWPLVDSLTPEIEFYLISAGFSVEYIAPWMAAELDNKLEISAEIPDKTFTIHNSNQDDAAIQFTNWAEAYCKGFNIAEELFPELITYTTAMLTAKDPCLNLFAINKDGRTAATGLLFISEQTAGLYSISVLPRFRGLGLGKFMTQSLMNFAQKRGCRAAILQSSIDGCGLYQRLGFRQTGFSPVYKYTFQV